MWANDIDNLDVLTCGQIKAEDFLKKSTAPNIRFKRFVNFSEEELGQQITMQYPSFKLERVNLGDNK